MSPTALIVVDSISAFSWVDKANADAAEREAAGPLSATAKYADFASVLRELKRLQDATAAPLVLTNHGIIEEDPDLGQAPRTQQPTMPKARDATGRASRLFPESPLPNGRWWSQHLPAPPYPSFVVQSDATSASAGAAPPSVRPRASIRVDYHITLQHAIPPQLPAGTRERAARSETARQKVLDQLPVRGWLRCSRSGAKGIFKFRIKDDLLEVAL